MPESTAEVVEMEPEVPFFRPVSGDPIASEELSVENQIKRVDAFLGQAVRSGAITPSNESKALSRLAEIRDANETDDTKRMDLMILRDQIKNREDIT